MIDETAVIGKEDQSFGIPVQPPCIGNPYRIVYIVADEPVGMIILFRCSHSSWFIKGEHHSLSHAFQHSAIIFNPVAFGNTLSHFGDMISHDDLSCFYKPVCFTP